MESEYSSELKHELEVADILRQEINSACADISEILEAQAAEDKSKSIEAAERKEASEIDAPFVVKAISVKTTPRMMNMSEILYKAYASDLIK